MKTILSILALTVLMFTLPTVSHATPPWETNEDVEYGLPKGDLIQTDLKAVNQYGTPVDFASLTGKNGIVLYIVRSAEWSRYCVFQLQEVSRKGSILEDTGYNIVVLSHDNQEKLKKFSERYDFPYPMISDPNSEIIKSFGLLNTEYLKGTAYHGVAYPAVYVIGYDGLILGKNFNVDYKKRPSLMEVRRMLDEIGDYESVLRKGEVENIPPQQ